MTLFVLCQSQVHNIYEMPMPCIYYITDIISCPMFVHGKRVCTNPESVVSYEAVGRM